MLLTIRNIHQMDLLTERIAKVLESFAKAGFPTMCAFLLHRLGYKAGTCRVPGFKVRRVAIV
jgi:hypothetical protein